jgi:S1-C subfamily serine protease
VAAVEEGSAADDAGVHKGDVIREIDRKPVRTLADYEKATAGLKAGSVSVRLLRGKASLYVALDLGRG